MWRTAKEEYSEDCCGATVKSGFEKIKVWGAIRYGKLSELIILPDSEREGKLTAVQYQDLVLDGELFDFWQASMEEEGYVMVMEDGAPYHKGAASARREQYEKNGWMGWGPGTWPASSPDLNPIENVWHMLINNIQKRKVQPKNREELIIAAKEEWAKLDLNKVNNLIDSMPRRIAAVREANGGPSGY